MLESRRIFITGGSSGIGLACAKLAMQYGAKVTLMARSEEKLAAAQEELGDGCWIYAGDVTSADDVEKAVAFAIESMDGLDGAVNCAGSASVGNIYELDDEAFESTLKVCLYGVMYATRAETAYMVENDIRGSIVNVSSLNSTVPYRMYTPYDAAKGGVDMLTRTASLELGPLGIRINAVCPGFTVTPLTSAFLDMPEVMKEIRSHTPLRRWGTSEEIAEVVCFMLSDKASYVTGVCLQVDGGMQNTAYPDIWRIVYEEDDDD